MTRAAQHRFADVRIYSRADVAQSSVCDLDQPIQIKAQGRVRFAMSRLHIEVDDSIPRMSRSAFSSSPLHKIRTPLILTNGRHDYWLVDEL